MDVKQATLFTAVTLIGATVGSRVHDSLRDLDGAGLFDQDGQLDNLDEIYSVNDLLRIERRLIRQNETLDINVKFFSERRKALIDIEELRVIQAEASLSEAYDNQEISEKNLERAEELLELDRERMAHAVVLLKDLTKQCDELEVIKKSLESQVDIERKRLGEQRYQHDTLARSLALITERLLPEARSYEERARDEFLSAYVDLWNDASIGRTFTRDHIPAETHAKIESYLRGEVSFEEFKQAVERGFAAGYSIDYRKNYRNLGHGPDHR